MAGSSSDPQAALQADTQHPDLLLLHVEAGAVSQQPLPQAPGSQAGLDPEAASTGSSQLHQQPAAQASDSLLWLDSLVGALLQQEAVPASRLLLVLVISSSLPKPNCLPPPGGGALQVSLLLHCFCSLALQSVAFDPL